MSRRRTLPWSWYTESDVLERERRDIFRSAWQYVGHTGMLSGPGSYYPTALVGVPIVVTTQGDDAVAALVNVCRHRGSIVCTSAGENNALRCPYHAWTYELDGTLRSAPRSDREDDWEPSTHSLTQLQLGRWGPFLFAAATADGPSFDEWIGDIPERVGEVLEVDDLRFLRRWEGTYQANWKICVENFLECYHCRIAHPAFSKVIDTGPDDYRLVINPHGSTQYGPVRESWTGPFDPSGPVRRGQFHLLNPNTAINIMPGHPNLSIGPVLPITPEETHRYLDYFVGPDVEDAWIADLVAFDDQVGAEDRPLVESVQRGMAAGMHADGSLFLDSERLIAHFADYVRGRLRDPRDGMLGR